MSRRRHTLEQVVRKLREADRLLSEGSELPEVLKQLEVAEATYHRRRNQFGGMKADDVRRFEGAGGRERHRLKRIVADQLLENQALREVLMLQDRLGLSERRACRYVGQPRSTQRHEPIVAQDDAALRAQLRAFSRERPRWGYRQAHQRLDRIVRERGRYPQFVRCDNGPEMTSNALRDWCRFSRTGAAFIEPGSPWENPFVESFNSRVRDELLSVEVFSCLAEAKVMVEDFRDDYNRRRPHRAHGMMTPTAFRTGWETAHQAAPASAELHDRYAIAPFDAGGSLTMKSPINHQLSQQVDP